MAWYPVGPDSIDLRLVGKFAIAFLQSGYLA